MQADGRTTSMRLFAISTVLSLLTGPVGLQATELRVTIPNPLRQDWPHELVSLDHRPSPNGVEAMDCVRGFPGGHRFVQWERIPTLPRFPASDPYTARMWFIASVRGPGSTDKHGRSKRERPPASFQVSMVDGGDPRSPLSLTEDGDFFHIRTGPNEFRIRNYQGLAQPVTIDRLPHWLGGFRLPDGQWDGKAFFEGKALVTDARTTIRNQGPVFIDLHIELRFAGPDEAAETSALPLLPSKRTHLHEPGVLPVETVPAREQHYEAVLRFVAGDNWVEVLERYRLPHGPEVSRDKQHQYWILVGDAAADRAPADLSLPHDQGWTIDTAMMVRWFEYDRFGGNDSLRFFPAAERPEQKGRPFAILRPVWHQRGGGSQDFFLTSGGQTPSKKQPDTAATYDPTRPCFGVVAGYASKWVDPYPATISAYAKAGSRGIKVPLKTTRRDSWYGQRSYALVIDQRGRLDTTGKVDSLVRRHTDWTLTALMNHYQLQWERDPTALGPHLLMNRQRLDELRAIFTADPNDPRLGALVGLHTRYRDLTTTREQIATALQRQQDPAALAELKSKQKAIAKQLQSGDMRFYALIAGDPVQAPRGPSPGRYFKRYQDDSTNPTNYGNRRMVNGPFPDSDLFTVTRPYGNAEVAAIGYIYSDLDAWPGWTNGWHPGNPNFHTDKYIAAGFAGACMPDHPHAARWLAFAKRNFLEDTKKVFTAPHGVGYECPGYAGYATHLQMEVARVFYNAGLGNPMAENPLAKATGIWHRKLLTPYDWRFGARHEAPHGDSHRWTAGLGAGFAELALFFKDSDPTFASELMGAYELLKASGMRMDKHEHAQEQLTTIDLGIPASPAEQLDWSSQYFHGFGVVFRDGFAGAGTRPSRGESFLSLKAGPTRGHYHNDELAFHFYADGTPLSLDYNCSYHPRGDHAALHNSMTFGRTGTVDNNKRGEAVEAMEQIHGSAWPGAVALHPWADVVVAERRNEHLVLSPVDPHDSEFARQYPRRKVPGGIVHRRWLAFVKHPDDSPFNDYLVVRDETRSPEPQQLNLHTLTRGAVIDGRQVRLQGQWDQDLLFHVADGTELRFEERRWHYQADKLLSPGDEYTLRAGETQTAWAERLQALQQAKGWTSLPAPDWRKQKVGKEADQQRAFQDWQSQIAATDGLALLPPPGWRQEAGWSYGEVQHWLRVHSQAGSPLLWVLYPHRPDEAVPTIRTLADGRGVELQLGERRERVFLSSDATDLAGQATIERGDERAVLLTADQVPTALGTIERKPLPDPAP